MPSLRELKLRAKATALEDDLSQSCEYEEQSRPVARLVQALIAAAADADPASFETFHRRLRRFSEQSKHDAGAEWLAQLLQAAFVLLWAQCEQPKHAAAKQALSKPAVSMLPSALSARATVADMRHNVAEEELRLILSLFTPDRHCDHNSVRHSRTKPLSKSATKLDARARITCTKRLQDCHRSPASVALQALDLLIERQCAALTRPNLLSVTVWRALQRLLLSSSHDSCNAAGAAELSAVGCAVC